MVSQTNREHNERNSVKIQKHEITTPPRIRELRNHFVEKRVAYGHRLLKSASLSTPRGKTYAETSDCEMASNILVY